MRRFVGIILVGCVVILGIGLHYSKPLWKQYTDFSLQTISGDTQYLENKSIRGEVVRKNEYNNEQLSLTLDGTHYFGQNQSYWQKLRPFSEPWSNTNAKRIYEDHKSLFRSASSGFNTSNFFENEEHVVLAEVENIYKKDGKIASKVKISVKDKMNDRITRYSRDLDGIEPGQYVYQNQVQIIDGQISLVVTQYGNKSRYIMQYLIPIQEEDAALTLREIKAIDIFAATDPNVDYNMISGHDLSVSSPYLVLSKVSNDIFHETPSVSYPVERINERQYAVVNLQDGSQQVIENEQMKQFIASVKNEEWLGTSLEKNLLVLQHENSVGDIRILTYNLENEEVAEYEVDYRTNSFTVSDGKLYMIPLSEQDEPSKEIMVVDYRTSELLYHGEVILKKGNKQDLNDLVIYSFVPF